MAMPALSVTSSTQKLPLQAMSMALPVFYPNLPAIFMNLLEAISNLLKPISDRQTIDPILSAREEGLHGR